MEPNIKIGSVASLIEDKVKQCEELSAEISKYENQINCETGSIVQLKNEIERVKGSRQKEIEAMEFNIKSMQNDITSIKEWLGKRPV